MPEKWVSSGVDVLGPGVRSQEAAGPAGRINKRPIVEASPETSRSLDLLPFFDGRQRRLLIHGAARLLIGVHADPELAGRVAHREVPVRLEMAILTRFHGQGNVAWVSASPTLTCA